MSRRRNKQRQEPARPVCPLCGSSIEEVCDGGEYSMYSWFVCANPDCDWSSGDDTDTVYDSVNKADDYHSNWGGVADRADCHMIPARTLWKALNRAKRYHRYIQKLKARIGELEAKLDQKSDVIERLVFGDPVTRGR